MAVGRGCRLLVVLSLVLEASSLATLVNRIRPVLARGSHKSTLVGNFLVVPEHHLLLCSIEKVGGKSLNNLVRYIRARYDPSMLEGNAWGKNGPGRHALDEDMLEKLLVNKSWHKAVFYRDPVERFVSGFRSKCEHADRDGARLCAVQFGDPSVSFSEAVRQISQFDNITNETEYYAKESKFNEHFRHQGDFCGGLRKNLPFYDTVEELTRDTSRDKVLTLLKKIDIVPESVPHFDELYPKSSDDEWEVSNHNTDTAAAIASYFPADKPQLLQTLLDHFKSDYEFLGMEVPSWAKSLRTTSTATRSQRRRRRRTETEY